MRLAIGSLALLLSASDAFAGQNEVLARCTLGTGYGYYAASPITPDDQADRFITDGFSQKPSQVILIMNGSDVDLITTDAIGTKSATGDGATVVPFVNKETGIIQVTTLYPEKPTVESYIFILQPDRTGKVIWTSARTGGGLLGAKIGAYVGECSP